MGTRRLVGWLDARTPARGGSAWPAFVVGVYVVVVLGGGVLIGSTDSPSLLLSILATAVVALLFAPVQTRARDARRPGPGTVGPRRRIDVLSRFSETLLDDHGHRRACRHAWRCCWLAGTGARLGTGVAERCRPSSRWQPPGRSTADDDRTPPSPQDAAVRVALATAGEP